MFGTTVCLFIIFSCKKDSSFSARNQYAVFEISFRKHEHTSQVSDEIIICIRDDSHKERVQLLR